ncbi:sensor domain-containing diguanylate cyclase [Thiocapsa imhoffii]|nr:diguanylate cyclase [Thiocapsa imhoffii]
MQDNHHDSAVAELGTLMGVMMVTILIALALTLVLLIQAGRVQDETALEASQRQVEGLIWMTGRNLANHVRDYAIWDEAFESILIARDLAWWDGNAGQYVLSTFDLDLTLAVDDDERLFFISTERETRTAPLDHPPISSSLRALLDAERRGDPSDFPERPATFGLFELDGTLYFGAVSRICREDEPSVCAAKPGALMLFAISVEERLVAELDEIMNGVELLRDPAISTTTAHLPLLFADGSDAGVLTWIPPAPGRSMTGSVLPLAVLAFLSIAGLTLFFALRARALARSLSSDERAHRRLLAQYESILETAGDGIFGVDATGRVQFVNPAAAHMLGYPRSELQGKDAHALLFSGQPIAAGQEDADSPLQRALVSGRSEIHDSAYSRRADGGRFPVEYSASPVKEHGQVTGAVVVFRDITKRRESEEEMFYRANYDVITELPNRNLLLERLGQELKLARREGKRVGVLFIDLDDFKAVNDTLGHHAGDLLLRQVAERLTRCLRETDTVARLGGDEFVVLLTHVVDHGATERIADMLICALRHGFQLAGHSVRVGASIGIAHFPDQGDTPEALIDHADAAMYQAKAAGRGMHRSAE